MHPGNSSQPSHRMRNEALRKVIILARGLGMRMREPDSASRVDLAQSEAADTGLKAMIPLGRPFLDFVLSALADAGYEEVCLVIGPEHDIVRRRYTEVTPPRRIQLRFAVQPEARGTADALLAAEKETGGEEFLVINSDNYYPVAVLRSLRTLGEPGTVLFEQDALVRCSNIPEERVRAFAYGKVGSDGYLEDLIEKPDQHLAAELRGHALVSMNCWRFSPRIFAACRRVPLSPRGEYELPAAVREAIGMGMKLKVLRSELGVLDLSRRADIPAVAERLKGVVVSL